MAGMTICFYFSPHSSQSSVAPQRSAAAPVASPAAMTARHPCASSVALFGCGNKACTRNLTLQDAKGQPTLNLCSADEEMVEGACATGRGVRGCATGTGFVGGAVVRRRVAAWDGPPRSDRGVTPP
jgi:hypothetical protein